jgi:hypothetical protein
MEVGAVVDPLSLSEHLLETIPYKPEADAPVLVRVVRPHHDVVARL